MRKIALLTSLLICLAQIGTASEEFDNLMIVDQSGAGQFTSITAALQMTIVLGFPGALGAAAARLLL